MLTISVGREGTEYGLIGHRKGELRWRRAGKNERIISKDWKSRERDKVIRMQDVRICN